MHADDGPLRVDLRDGSGVIDRGDRLEARGSVTSVTVTAMLEMARAHRWVSLEFSGSDDFKRQATVLAVRAGFDVSNPELQQIVSDTRRQMQREAEDRRRLEAALQVPQALPSSASRWRAPLWVGAAERRLATARARSEIRDETIRTEVLRDLAGDRLRDAAEALRTAYADQQRAQERADLFRDDDEPTGFFVRRTWRRERDEAVRDAEKARDALKAAEAAHGAIVSETEVSPEYRDRLRERLAERQHARDEVERLEEWRRSRRPVDQSRSVVVDDLLHSSPRTTLADRQDHASAAQPDPADDLPKPG